MRKIIQTLGVGVVGALALPVAGTCALAAIISLFMLLFTADRSLNLLLFCLATSALAGFSWKTVTAMSHWGRQLVENINRTESLTLNPANMLGLPSPTFFAFDKANRKLAICNSITGEYDIHDFRYIHKWRYEWDVGVRINVGVAAGMNNMSGASLYQPTVSRSGFKKGFVLVLDLADDDTPVFKFPMQTEAMARHWCARLNTIYHG